MPEIGPACGSKSLFGIQYFKHESEQEMNQ